MTLPVTPEHLSREIEVSRTALKRRRAGVREIVQGMAQNLTLRKGGDAQRLIENHYHEYVSLVLPRIVSGDPRVRVVTPKGGEARTAAGAGEAAVNQWIVDTRHRVLCQKLCTDFLVGWGVACLRLEGRPEDDDLFTTVSAHRLDPGDAWWDLRSTWEEKRFSGYSYVIDKNDLRDMARARPDDWNLAAIEALPEDGDLEEIERREKEPVDVPNRGEVVLRVVHVPDYTLPGAPSWSNGTIFTIGVAPGTKTSTRDNRIKADTALFVRKPRPFYGPPWGFLYLYDAYHIPGESLGMSPCEAVRGQVDELNAHANLLSESLSRMKSVAMGAAARASDMEKVRVAQDGDTIALEYYDGFKESVLKEVVYGGADAEQRVAAIQLFRDRLYRGSGLDEAFRGRATPNVTATATAEAAESAGVRIAYLSQRFTDCDEQLLKGVLWHVTHTPSLRMNVDPEMMGATPDEAKNMSVRIRGGKTKGMEWDDYRLSLDRYSMARTSEATQQARAQQMIATTLQVAEAAPRIAPYADIELMMSKVGDAYNDPTYARIFSPDKAAQIGEMQMQAEMEPEAPVEAA